MDKGSKYSPSSITRPIPLLATVCILIETIVGTVTALAKGTPSYDYLLWAIVILPVLWGIVIYRLITKYPGHLYHPGEYPGANQFLEAIKTTSGKIFKLSDSNGYNIFDPLKSSDAIPTKKMEEIEDYISQLEMMLNELDADDLATLHSWYNALNKHQMALLCMDIAIAKGRTSSESFSFRSASLRKIGRLIEAKKSAETALEIDATNADAYYNLAILSKMKDDGTDYNEIVTILTEMGAAPYLEKLVARR